MARPRWINHDVVNLHALHSTADTVLAWRLRPGEPIVKWPLTGAGSLVAALAAAALLAGLHVAVDPYANRISWQWGALLLGGVWLTNLLIARRTRAVRKGLRQPGSPARRYEWTSDMVFGLCLLTILVLSQSAGQTLPPGGVLAAGFACTTVSVATSFRLVRTEAERRPTGFGKTLAQEFGSWHNLTEQLQTAGSKLEQRHAFFGVIIGTSLPLLLDDKLLNSHIAVFGGTRSGKSSRALLPLMIQKIRNNRKDRAKQKARGKRCVILYFDLKGSAAEFGALGDACRRAGINFRWVTTESGLSSYVLNALTQPEWQSLSVNERAQLLLAMLGLEFGEARSGDAYYAGVVDRLLAGVFTICPGAQSFRELYEAIIAPDFRDRIGMSKHDFDNCGALLSHLRRLAEMGPLNWLPGQTGSPRVGEGAILIEQLLREPGVVYFRLPATVEPLSAKVVPRLVIRLLVAAAKRLGGAELQVYVVIDEAQETMQRSLGSVLKQARVDQISVWMAMQNISDLEAAGAGLGEVVMGNTSIRIFFSASDQAARQYLMMASGEQRRIVHAEGTSITETSQGTNIGRNEGQHEVIVPGIGADEANWLNAHEGVCVVEAAPQSGYTVLKHPAFVRTPYFCDEKKWKRLGRTSWPKANAFTVMNESAAENLALKPKPNTNDESRDGTAGAAVVASPSPPSSDSAMSASASVAPPPKPRRGGRRKTRASEAAAEHQQLALELLKLAEQPVTPTRPADA